MSIPRNLVAPPKLSDLTQDQNDAISQIKTWFQSSNTKQYFVLAGSAGTGKSYVTPLLPGILNINPLHVKYAAFTNKAALVLKRKNLDATTIHSLIYEPHEEIDPKTKEKIIVYVKAKHLPGYAKLIVIDEASMISKEIHDDLLSFHVKVLYMGDHFQLPPVKDNFSLLVPHLINATLTTPHRFALQNPITKIAIDLKNLQMPQFTPVTDKNPFPEFQYIRQRDLSDNTIQNASQILTGLNKNRTMLNNYVRLLLGFDGKLPQKGERLIILQNYHKLDLFNGQQILLMQNAHELPNGALSITFDDESIITNLLSLLHYKEQKQTFQPMSLNPHFVSSPTLKFKFNKFVEADYAHAITVHKGQGSEWERVLVYDDHFNSSDIPNFHYRWLYTAVTRASKQLCIVDAG